MDTSNRRIDIRFYDENLNFLDEIDDYNGFEFVTRWRKYGEFKIFVRGITEHMKKGNFIMLENSHRKSGIIKRIKLSDDVNEYDEVTGFTLEYLLTQRLTFPPPGRAYHEFNAPAEDIICALVNANLIDAADHKRNVSILEMKPSKGRGDRLQWRTRYDRLSDAVETLCNASGLGIAAELDLEQKKIVFEVKVGTDRSINNGIRPPMIFNVDYDNVKNREYISDVSDYKNTAVTAGQGDGIDRKIQIVGDENSGIDRYEMFVDARDIEDDSQLSDRGKAKLAEYAVVDSYSSQVDADKYEKEWDLGDIAGTIDEEYGVYMNERIVEVREEFGKKGYEVSPTFGTIVKTILDKIQDTTRNQPVVDNIKGDPGEPGKDGADGATGPQGYSLQFNWKGTQLGVKREDQTSYQYTDLRGQKGETGDTGPVGPKGDPGVRGEIGPQGQTGQQGPPGKDGAGIHVQAEAPQGVPDGTVWIQI